MLTLSDLSCARGDRILFSGANLVLRPGELLHVTGANGAGKTSLLRLVAGLALPEHGEVEWCGEPIRRLREDFARHLMFFGHAVALKDELTSIENLVVSSAISGRNVSFEQAVSALRQFGLKGREDLPARVLSAGQRRKVNLARMLLPDPPMLWVLDEPFTALDVRAVSQLVDVLRGHLSSGGMVVYTTHQEVEFLGHSARKLVIDSGKAIVC